jgi:hypothetical protein
VFVGRLITMTGFRSSAPKAQNGFVAWRFVSSSLDPTKQFLVDPNDFRRLALRLAAKFERGPPNSAAAYDDQATSLEAAFLLLSGG